MGVTNYMLLNVCSFIPPATDLGIVLQTKAISLSVLFCSDIDSSAVTVSN